MADSKEQLGLGEESQDREEILLRGSDLVTFVNQRGDEVGARLEALHGLAVAGMEEDDLVVEPDGTVSRLGEVARVALRERDLLNALGVLVQNLTRPDDIKK